MSRILAVTLVTAAGLGLIAPEEARPAPDLLPCNLPMALAAPGLSATVSDDVLIVVWDGAPGEEVRLELSVDGGIPRIQQMAARSQGEAWNTVVTDAIPEFRVVTGLRRVTEQQLTPLREMGVELTEAIIDATKWDAFWDAPLYLGRPSGYITSLPPVAGVLSQPGLPRSPLEIDRASAEFDITDCTVQRDGARIEVVFAGLVMGPFEGELRFTVYRGTNLIRMEVAATTNEPSLAYKYEAGLKGLSVENGSRLMWRDLSGHWQSNWLGGAPNIDPVSLKSANRVIVTESGRASVAAFPPPHTFFWAREVDSNLGYSWFRKDDSRSFSFGIRQADGEEIPQWQGNFPLYSARPGTLQRMPVYFYVAPGAGQVAAERVLAFTNGDRFRPLPGYKVMASHFHTDLGQRLLRSGSLDTRLPDFDAFKTAGIDIVSTADSPRPLDVQAAALEGARRHSDRDFLIMPATELFSNLMGGHTDVLLGRPVLWTEGRTDDAPLVVEDSLYGTVYRLNDSSDMMEMLERENGVVFMPHPRTKGSTGYPDAIKETDHFRHERYRGVGWRWAMGLDLSERRMSELRVLPLLDEMNNWGADLSGPPKYLLAMNETYDKAPGDDVYAMGPVNYLKLSELPGPDERSPIVDVLRRGDFFVTSGEVLIPSFTVLGTGAERLVAAEVEWTFPLEMVELVWGDGTTTDRTIVSATELPPFESRRFEIPVPLSAIWIRFAAWDSAGNGAIVQPFKLGEEPL